jgi:hypothetical protein
MSDDSRLHRLMTGLIRGAPPQPERLGAVLGKATAIRRRRRAVAAAGTAAVAVVAVSAGLLVLGPDHPSAQDNLFTDDPTPTVTTEPTPTAEPSSTPSPTGTPNTPDPSATAPAAGPTVVLRADSLLPDDFVEGAFGAGKAPDRSTTTRALPGLIRSCYHLSIDDPAPRSFIAKSWNWPGEVVFSEVLAREPSKAAAGDRYRTCTDPTARLFDRDAQSFASDGDDPRTFQVDLMEHGFGEVVVVPRALDTSIYAAAQLDDVVLVLTWRQTGPIPDDSAMARALVGAVRRATGGDEGGPVVAPAQQVPDVLKGMLTRDGLPRPWPWVHDAQENSPALRCANAEAPVAAAPVSRTWSTTNTYEPGDTLPYVTIRFATASDASTAATAFAACKQGFVAAGQQVEDAPADHPGDEAFTVELYVERYLLVVRSGAGLLAVEVENEDTVVIARAALAALSAAGRL